MRPTASPASRPDPAGARRGRPLRGLVGGYEIARWPITVRPLGGEHAVSWLWRVAYRYGMTPSTMLAALGLPQANSSVTALEACLRRYVQVLAAVLGAQPASSRDPVRRDRVLDAELERYVSAYQHGRLPPRRFQFCPACLAETDGTWRQSWWTRCPGVCPTHQVMMLTHCPSCGAVPFARPVWMAAETAPWICPQLTEQQPPSRHRRRRCGYDLRHAPTTPPSEQDAATLAALEHLAHDAARSPAREVTVAGFVTTARHHLDAVFELLDEGSHIALLVVIDAEATRNLLDQARTALTILDQPTALAAVDVAESHGLLDPGGHHTPIVTDLSVRRRAHNPLLAAIRLRSLEEVLPPTAQLVFRLGSHSPRYPQSLPKHPEDRPRDWEEQLPLSSIPQVLWPGVVTPWIADDDIPGRAAASMLLAKLGSTRPWSLIALDLGLPAAFATRPGALIRRLRRAGAWRAFLRALDDLAVALTESPPPIDYSARRWATLDLARIVEALQNTGHALTDLDDEFQRELALYVWQVYTGGDTRYHPRETTDRSLGPFMPDGVHGPLDPGDMDRVTTELHRLAGEPDSGPLEWRPP